MNALLALKVAPEQQSFVASNAHSLAQAHFYPDEAWFRAIYAGEQPAGFLMLSFEEGLPRRETRTRPGARWTSGSS